MSRDESVTRHHHELTVYHVLLFAAIEISDEEAEKVFSVEDAVELISKSLDVH